MGVPVLRAALPEDAVAFWGHPPALSFRGFVAEIDGEVVGVGGVFYDEARRPIAFSEMREPMRKHLKAKAKAVRMIMGLAMRRHDRFYAVAQQDEPTAAPLLAKLGFRPTGQMTPVGELLVWEKT